MPAVRTITPMPSGEIQLRQRVAQHVAIVALDAPRNSAGARVVRHQYEIAPGEADEGRQRRALGAALFLVDLDDHFLTFFDQVLDAAFAFSAFLREVGAGDFLQRQEAVAFRSEFDERGLEAGFDARDARFVDAGFFLFAAAVFDVEVVDSLTVDERDPDLFGLRRIDEHSFHVVRSIVGP